MCVCVCVRNMMTVAARLTTHARTAAFRAFVRTIQCLSSANDMTMRVYTKALSTSFIFYVVVSSRLEGEDSRFAVPPFELSIILIDSTSCPPQKLLKIYINNNTPIQSRLDYWRTVLGFLLSAFHKNETPHPTS